jgi:hypothetical protein
VRAARAAVAAAMENRAPGLLKNSESARHKGWIFSARRLEIWLITKAVLIKISAIGHPTPPTSTYTSSATEDDR